MKHTPLHQLHRLGPGSTAGRVLHLEGGQYLENAHARVPIDAPTLPNHTLTRVEADWDGRKLVVHHATPTGPTPQA